MEAPVSAMGSPASQNRAWRLALWCLRPSSPDGHPSLIKSQAQAQALLVFWFLGTQFHSAWSARRLMPLTPSQPTTRSQEGPQQHFEEQGKTIHNKKPLSCNLLQGTCKVVMPQSPTTKAPAMTINVRVLGLMYCNIREANLFLDLSKLR